MIKIYDCHASMHVGNCDGTNINDLAIIGAIVGVYCTVIMIMVITNIMVWIYCIRRMDYKGGTMVLSENS